MFLGDVNSTFLIQLTGKMLSSKNTLLHRKLAYVSYTDGENMYEYVGVFTSANIIIAYGPQGHIIVSQNKNSNPLIIREKVVTENIAEILVSCLK